MITAATAPAASLPATESAAPVSYALRNSSGEILAIFSAPETMTLTQIEETVNADADRQGAIVDVMERV